MTPTDIPSKKYVIITAGGSGSRMKSKVAKQFLEIDGKPILLHTINLFRSLPFEVEIILVIPNDYRAYWDDYCRENEIAMRCRIAKGGITRFHSVKNGLELTGDSGIVAIHDGVRPFADKDMIAKMFSYNFATSEDVAGVIPVMPAVESMRRILRDKKGNPVGTQTVDRADYISVQTPQVFDLAKLKTAYKQPYLPQFTDDASVIEKAGYKVDTIPGNRLNIKITVPQDLELAEVIYSSLVQSNL